MLKKTNGLKRGGWVATESMHLFERWNGPWPLSTHAFTRESRTLTGKSGSVSCGDTAPFPWVLVCTRFCRALQESVSPVLWKFCNQIPLAFKVKFSRGSQSLCWMPRLGNLLWALEVLRQQGHSLVRQAVGWGRVWWGNGSLQECLCQWVLARTATANVLVHTVSHHCPSSVGDLAVSAGMSAPISCPVTCFFPWVLVCTRYCVCPPRVEFLFYLVLWNSCNQTSLVFKIRFSGDSSSCCLGGRTFTPLAELLWYNSFPVCGCHLECVELYLIVIVPLLPSLVASSLALDVSSFFFWSFQHFCSCCWLVVI